MYNIYTLFFCFLIASGLKINLPSGAVSPIMNSAENASIVETEKEQLEIAKENAFRIARKAFKHETYHKKYKLENINESNPVYVEILIGDLLCTNEKHFLLRRHTAAYTVINLYSIKKGGTNDLIEHQCPSLNYIRDTIFDANGDGYKDFLIHSYPSSGCCTRNIYNLFIFLEETSEFTSTYEFMNPTFFPEEKIIRGVEYGQPGETGLYKFKWDNLNIDSIEFIYPDVNNKGQFIMTKHSDYKPTSDDGIILQQIPEEYHNIESLNWFLDY